VFSVVSVVTPPSQQDTTTASREYTEVYKILRVLCGLCGNPPITAGYYHGEQRVHRGL